MNAANVIHTLDAQQLRQARKPGVYDTQIRAARSVRAHSLLKASPVADLAAFYWADKGFTKGLCGTVLTSEIQQLLAEHKEWADNRVATLHQAKRLHHTDQGDFTNCFRRGI